MGRLQRFFFFLSSITLLILIFSALFAPYITRYSYDTQRSAFDPPNSKHFLGTDNLGRDVFSRLIFGARVSLSIGFSVEAVTLILGLIVGLTAGFKGGLFDTVLMRFTDAMFAFPDILLAILIIGIVGPGTWSVFGALTVVGWPVVARIVRGQVVALKEREFIIATRSMGSGGLRITLLHIVPHVLPILLAFAAIDITSVILAESSLSFLGIGVQPPHPSWGGMINSARDTMRLAPALLFYPCALLSVTVICFNIVGDQLRQLWDPRAINRI